MLEVLVETRNYIITWKLSFIYSSATYTVNMKLPAISAVFDRSQQWSVMYLVAVICKKH